jgi:RNA polymerase sigma-70 factor (ECF subfamily)
LPAAPGIYHAHSAAVPAGRSGRNAMTTTSVSLLDQLRLPSDQAAWARFVHLYTPLLWQWAVRLGLQPADAADLVQDVFVVLIRKLPEFDCDRDRSFRGWLRTVLENKWRDHQRRRSAQVVDAHDPVFNTLAVAAETDAFDEAEYRRYLTGRALHLIQSEFQPATWQAFWQVVVLDRPVADVAREVGLKPNAVYQAKFRVLRRLRDELQGLLD